MNIALFTESYKPYVSGVTTSVGTLVRELRALGHRVFVFAPGYKGHRETDPDTFRFPSAPTRYPGFRIAVPFLRRMPDIEIDVVHSHSPFQLGILARRLSRKKKVPLIYTLHTFFDQYLHYVPLLPRRFAKRLLSGHLRHYCESCDRVIVPSKPVGEYLIQNGVKANIDVVPTGIDFELAKSFTGKGVRERHGIPKSDTVLIYVGRLTKEKNLPFLFESFSLVLKDHPRARLMIVARGPMEGALRSLAKKFGLSKRVTFAGQVRYPEVFDYYSAADIFVFSSTTETQGLVIGEAAASGLPVVAVDSSGVSDAVADGESGFLTPHDTKAFAGKVGLLISSEEKRKKMSNAAAALAKKKFSSKAYAEKMTSVYSHCLKFN